MTITTHFDMVKEFNLVLGNGIGEPETVPSEKIQKLRMELIEEEAVYELGKAMFENNLIEVADAIGDSLVVIYGAATDWGIDCHELGQDFANMKLTMGQPPMEVQADRLDQIHQLAVVKLEQAMMTGDNLRVHHAIRHALEAVYNAANDWGIDTDPVMTEIHRSNMSKLCRSLSEAKYAVDRYAAGEGYQNKFKPIQADYRYCEAKGFEGCFIVFQADNGKTLKGPRYQLPRLEFVLDALKRQQLQ